MEVNLLNLKKIARLSLISLLVAAFLVPSTVNALSPEQRRVFDSGIQYFDVEDYSVCNSIGIVNGSVDRFLQVLAFQESGGDPLADASPASSASGKYQYIDRTWQSRSTIYGPSDPYTRALQAPEPIQDAVAYIEYTQKFKDLGNDLFKLAVSHFYPLANNNPELLDTVPGNNVITPRQYAERLINNIGNGIGATIPLRYNEAPEFGLWLEKVGGAPPSVNSGSGGCANSATGGTIVAIAERELAAGANQADGSHQKYGGSQGEPWCAYFVSWVFKEAGKPFDGGTIPAVSGMLAYAQEHGYYYEVGAAGFTPQPGDVVIYKEGISPFPSHVNIVISYDAASNTYTSIGGNESNTIKKQSFSVDLPAITGFMRIP